MNRRKFLASAIAAALAPKELPASDGVALNSTFHRTYGTTIVIDSVTGFGLPPTDPGYQRTATWLHRALLDSLRQTQSDRSSGRIHLAPKTA